jgi:hypothetical protein
MRLNSDVGICKVKDLHPTSHHRLAGWGFATTFISSVALFCRSKVKNPATVMASPCHISFLRTMQTGDKMIKQV